MRLSLLLLLTLACDGALDTADTGGGSDTADTAGATDSADSADSADTDDTNTGTAGGDQDGDGVTDEADCAPMNADRFPGNTETCDHVDNDCSGQAYDLPATREYEAGPVGGASYYAYRMTLDATLNQTYFGSGSALASLTSEAWYDYSSHGLTESRTSTDGDPTTIEAVRTLSYDADGRLITDETDEGDDGTIDTWKACVFAADGTSVCTFDSFADGVNAVSYVNEYDELGNITREERDLDFDGNVDGARTWAYTYDGLGQILTTHYDDNGDGVVGAADSLSTNVWDTDGHVVRTEFDRGLDGVADSVSTNEYDGLARLVRMTQDYDADGLLDFEYTLLWSVEGNLSQTGRLTSEGERWPPPATTTTPRAGRCPTARTTRRTAPPMSPASPPSPAIS